MTSRSNDITFHYPPELFNLLVDVVPLLSRSKRDVLLFFRGAGVPDAITADLSARLKSEPTFLFAKHFTWSVSPGRASSNKSMASSKSTASYISSK
jgi:hypothetical protein